MTDFEPVDVSRDSLLDTRTAAKESQGKVRSRAFSHRPFFGERPPRAALLRALEAPLTHPMALSQPHPRDYAALQPAAPAPLAEGTGQRHTACAPRHDTMLSLTAPLLPAQTGSVARLLLVGKYSVEMDELTESVRGYMAGAADETFTGALMFFDGSNYSKVVFLTLEASSEGLEAFMTGSGVGLFEEARVMGFSDDLAERAWAVFGTAVVNQSASSTELYERAELAAALGPALASCANLGRSLRDAAEAEPEELSERIAAGTEFHPPALLLISVLGTEGVYTLERYCERYISGCKLDLASEKVWPSQELQLSY